MRRQLLRKMMRVSITVPLLLLEMVGSACCAGESGKVTAVGVLGDSYSDEYRFYPPDRSTSQNWVEILAMPAA